MEQIVGKILVVDDELNIRKGLRAILARCGHNVKDAASAQEALATLNSFACEVAIVDIRMPDMSGVELLSAIHAHWPSISVVLLTGHASLESAMAAVKAGAYDYLLKPVQPEPICQIVVEALAASRYRKEQMTLLASLRTSLHRLDDLHVTPSDTGGSTEGTLDQQHAENRQIQIGDLQIDLQAHEVRCDGDPIPLTLSEYNVLRTLASRLGEIVDYVALVQFSLKYVAEVWEAKELIKRHILTLRQKIEVDPSDPRYILNVRGVGYRLVAPTPNRTDLSS